jgi:MoaA/NifB/PqqE/SkfB family radical SAM enzyme
MDDKLGNIRENSFESIWNSKKAEEVRKNVGKLQCQTCWLECEVYREINKNKIELGKTYLQSLVGMDRIVG